MVTKTEDYVSHTVTVTQYDSYGNTVRTETTQTEDGQTTVSISSSTYDASGRLILSKSDNSEIEYIYDKAGRVLRSKADGKYQRTVYDSKGRTIQEIDNADYNPDIDDLSAEYPDKTVGHRYEYDSVGNLVKETNRLNLATTYDYSTVGSLRRKHFDIYDYYYQNNGKCDKIDVNGKTIVDYEYKVAQSETSDGEKRIRNRITYADGYVEEELTDKYGNVIQKYANGEVYYSCGTTDRIIYTDKNNSQYDMLLIEDDSSTYTQYDFTMRMLFSYSTKTVEDKTTVTQKHFSGKTYEMSPTENAISYTTPSLSFSYTTDGEENTATSKIVKDNQDILSAAIHYDEDKDKLSKSYNIEGFAFSTTYDEDGNVISDEQNSYTYDSLGELVQTNGAVNAAYTYDSRGNMLSKAVNGETTTFEYGNTQWQDQLTKVNGKSLTYDANGNLQSYDGAEYTWSHGKQLSSITKGDSTFKYQYDLNGIRSYKTVNGVTTKFDTLNGKILAQSDKNNKILFQYNGDTPIGFELNETQYFYLTNLSGDVVGITDADGNLIAEYSYDEWGKLLSIETAEDGNAEQQNIAELNPLRYRGYYYDSETGMYYLQSRYYNPEFCRFISADGFEYADTSGELNANLYMYCWNNAVTFKDAEGTTPKLAISFEDIVVYFVNLGRKLKDKADESAAKTKAKINKLVSKWDKSIKTHYNAFIDKLEYAINYPDVVINNFFSKIGKEEWKVRFRLVEYIRSKHEISLNWLKAPIKEEQSAPLKSKAKTKDSADSIKETIMQVLCGGIIIQAIYDFFKALKIDLDKIMEKSIKENWFNTFKEIMITSVLLITATYDEFVDYFNFDGALSDIYSLSWKKLLESNEDMGDFEEAGKGKSFLRVFSLIAICCSFSDKMNNAGNGHLSKETDKSLAIISLVIDIASLFVKVPFVGAIVSHAGSIIPKIIAMKKEGYVVW